MNFEQPISESELIENSAKTLFITNPKISYPQRIGKVLKKNSCGQRFAPVVADLLELSAICWNNQVDWLVISHPILDSVVKTHYLC